MEILMRMTIAGYEEGVRQETEIRKTYRSDENKGTVNYEHF